MFVMQVLSSQLHFQLMKITQIPVNGELTIWHYYRCFHNHDIWEWSVADQQFRVAVTMKTGRCGLVIERFHSVPGD